jgi:hypothetical protein
MATGIELTSSAGGNISTKSLSTVHEKVSNNQNTLSIKNTQSHPSLVISAHNQAMTQLGNNISQFASETWQDVKTIDKEYAVSQRALGGLEGVGGLAEAAIGAIGVVAPEPLTSVGGAILMAHGSDVEPAGLVSFGQVKLKKHLPIKPLPLVPKHWEPVMQQHIVLVMAWIWGLV